MTELEKAIMQLYRSQGQQQDMSKVHALMLKSKFILPTEANSLAENPQALFYVENDNYFVPVFDSMGYYQAWAEDSLHEISHIEINGIDLISGLSDNSYLCLNIGSTYYKEFAPDEIARLKSIIRKIKQ